MKIGCLFKKSSYQEVNSLIVISKLLHKLATNYEMDYILIVQIMTPKGQVGTILVVCMYVYIVE